MKDLNFITTAKNLSVNIVFIVIVRILLVSIIMFFLTNDKPKNITELQSYYNSSCSFFYILFLGSLDRYLQYSNKKIANPQLLANSSLYTLIKYLKWLLLIITLALLILTILMMPIEWPSQVEQKLLYVLVKFFPNLFGANISFIIITMLVFYADTIASLNKKLKHEQDLTI